MSEQGIYLYEFLYRGRPPGATEAPAYHVVLAQEAVDGFGNTSTVTSLAMTPDAARERGFDLPDIIAAIDTATMSENAGLNERLAALRAELAAAGVGGTDLAADAA